MPRQTFFDIIVLDDRPSKGGALPDFWEPILSQIINIVSKNKNITNLLINGDLNNGKEFCNIIKDIETWDNEYIQWLSEKTKCKIKDIQETKSRLTNNIFFESNEENIILHLFNIYSDEKIMLPVDNINVIDSETRILSRKNDLEEKYYLKNYDGIRISTICEAYPIMLDIVRSMVNEKNTEFLIDQAGREFI